MESLLAPHFGHLSSITTDLAKIYIGPQTISFNNMSKQYLQQQ